MVILHFLTCSAQIMKEMKGDEEKDVINMVDILLNLNGRQTVGERYCGSTTRDANTISKLFHLLLLLN